MMEMKSQSPSCRMRPLQRQHGEVGLLHRQDIDPHIPCDAMTTARSSDQWDKFHVPIRSPRDWGPRSATSSSEEAMAKAMAVDVVHTHRTAGAARGIGQSHLVINRGRGGPMGVL